VLGSMALFVAEIKSVVSSRLGAWAPPSQGFAWSEVIRSQRAKRASQGFRAIRSRGR